jgi:SynChlorMet cassette protein ScmC
MKNRSERVVPPSFVLSLADDSCLVLYAGDETAARVLDFLARTAQLSPVPDLLPAGARCLLVATDGERATRGNLPYTADTVCVLASPDAPRRRRRVDLTRTQSRNQRRFRRPDPEPMPEEQWLWQQLARLSAAIARETQHQGGVLLHSGLAAYPNLADLQDLKDLDGILLAGRSGVGKTTASHRLGPPWHALADDVTLVARDTEGSYWAHPWPTWSWFFGKEDRRPGGGVWDVQRAVPLRAIFVLEQGGEDRVGPLGPGHAVALLAVLARHYLRGKPLDEIAAFNSRRFDNLCALVRTVPAYLLHVSLDGAFWTEIERVIYAERIQVS